MAVNSTPTMGKTRTWGLWSTRLDEIKNPHLTDSIDTESSSTRGRSVWVHSTLLDSSVPAGEGGAVGNGVARSLGTEPS